VIFCNPNACYYEYLPYQTEWINYYYNLGVNLVVWNYRCYGRSQGGSISPTAIMKDGEKVYQYVKSNLVTGKIGIHGESLGGCVAPYVAKKCQVDFLFSDRTFASVVDIAHWGFGGQVASLIFRFLTGWNEECWKNFNEVNMPNGQENRAFCYKLLGSDPEDNIVSDLASMKSALSKNIVVSRLSSLTPEAVVAKSRSVRIHNYLISDDNFDKLKYSLESLFEMIHDFDYRNLY
jgi:hypothetical protein